MEANKILKSDMLDILFENRNKEYGAYELRRKYNKRITIALLATLSLIIVTIGAAALVNTIEGDDAQLVEIRDVELINIKEETPPPPPEPPPPPPPTPEPPPKVEMAKFTPPVIVEDKLVRKEDVPPDMDKLQDVKIDVISQEGVKDPGIVAPPTPDAGRGVVVAPKVEDENRIFEKVEVDAAFPGGEQAWIRYLQRNLNAQVAADNNAPPGQYQVVVQFIVDREGNISDVKALSSHGYGMEREAIRAIQRGPKWTPALQNGRYVTAYRRQPITFVVQEGY